jgi:hypothetical protein
VGCLPKNAVFGRELSNSGAHADLFRKNAEGLWVLHPIAADGTITLQSVNLSLPLAGAYADVDLPAQGAASFAPGAGI